MSAAATTLRPLETFSNNLGSCSIGSLAIVHTDDILDAGGGGGFGVEQEEEEEEEEEEEPAVIAPTGRTDRNRLGGLASKMISNRCSSSLQQRLMLQQQQRRHHHHHEATT